jgi:predicted secreted protein
MATNGNNIFISLGTDTAPIAATRSNEIQSQAETIEISSPTTGEWRQYIAGRKEWSLTVGWLIGANSDLTQLLNVGTTYAVNIYGRGAESNTKILTGSALLTSCKITASRGHLVQGSFSFTGSGALAVPSS